MANPTSLSVQQDVPVDNDSIAIVGLACRTPGADNQREFWRLLSHGECHVTDVPADRWNAKAYLDPDDQMAHGKACVQKGAFIKDPDWFDNGVFGLSDFEASQMDPQQYFLLESTLMALQDAGITRESIGGSNTGVFIGSMNNDYQNIFSGHNSKVGPYNATGVSTTILASRLSYVFDLRGPCMVLDTACSASVVAMHQACQAIRAGDCDMAVCGGVNSMSIPDPFTQLSKAQMLSPSGLCHTFSDKADGYTRGEGCGVLILKRLKDALQDGDKVWATAFTGSNQDGHCVTPMTAPSGEQQRKLIQHIYDKYNIDAGEIKVIEAHGTGTQAGDPVEVNALGAFFQGRGPPQQRYIGSVKTNIGHTESAAGVLGLIKMVLMMKHNTIVPSLHCHTVNPKIDLKRLNFVIPKDTVPWTDERKVGACNCFGFGGSNSHVVVKSVPKPRVSKEGKTSSCVVCFSGTTKKSLADSLEDFLGDVEAPVLDVHDVSFTSTVRRDHYPWRKAFVADSMEQLLADVADQVSQNKFPAPKRNPNLIFVFCGMGTTWDGMCRQLLKENQAFSQTVYSVEKCLREFVPWSLTERFEKEDPTNDPLLAPIAIFACQLGLVAMWKSLGVQASCVVGQSIGEVAAAYTAGCLSLPDAVRIIYQRSQLLTQVTGGAMVVIMNVAVDRVRQALKGHEQASISLVYSPVACAVSTTADQISSVKTELLTKLKEEFKFMRILDLGVSVAYHSQHVESCEKKLKTALTGVSAAKPSIPIVSSVTGSRLDTPADKQYWADNLRKPVLFHQAMLASVEVKPSNNTIFVEIGPKPVLQAHLNDLFPEGKTSTVCSIQKDAELRCFLDAVGKVYESGANISWQTFQSQRANITDVPRYIFQKKFLREKNEMEMVMKDGCNIYTKTHPFIFPLHGKDNEHLIMLSPLCTPTIYDHIVSGSIIVPGALYAEAGFALAKYCNLPQPVAVSVEFKHPLSLKRDEAVGIPILPRSGHLEHSHQFAAVKNGKEIATIEINERERVVDDFINLDFLRARCPEENKNREEGYKIMASLGFQYGPNYQLLHGACHSENECLTEIRINEAVQAEMCHTSLHPAILDNMLQSTTMIGPKGRFMLPKSIGSVQVFGAMESIMYVYVRQTHVSKDFYVYDEQLLSSCGRVLVEVRNLVFQALTAESDDYQLPLLNMEWRKLETLTEPLSLSTGHKISVNDSVFITDVDVHVKENISVIKYKDSLHEDKLMDDVIKALTERKSIQSVILFCSQTCSPDEKSDEIQTFVLNMCCLIQTILVTLYENEKLSSPPPVYVCTCNAWSALSPTYQNSVNPAQTALWGLLRTVLIEQAYPHLTSVEMQLSSQDIQGLSLPQFIVSVVNHEELQDYPEILVTAEGMFVNQITKPSASLFSEKIWFHESTSLSATEFPFLEKVSPLKKAINPTTMKKVNLKTFVCPSQELLKMRGSSSSKQDDKSAGLAVELTGCTVDEKEMVISCCPVTIKPEVLVPADTLIPLSLIPKYEPGDVSKLVLLWEIMSQVHGKEATVLASPGTQTLASLLQTIGRSMESTVDVKVVQLHDLLNEVSLHGTIISLVALDVAIVHTLSILWEEDQCLVTCSSLAPHEVQVYMGVAMPTAKQCFINMHTVFHPKCLSTTIPELKLWLLKQEKHLDHIMDCLHIEDQPIGSPDMARLFQFQSGTREEIMDKEGHLFRKDGIYMVVGGLTGLGWICTQFLAQHHAGHILILNRRAASNEKLAEMKQLSTTQACEVKAVQADLSSPQSLQNALQQMSKLFPNAELKGVFTGAAVTEDTHFQEMRRDAFNTVLSPKVQGTWNLHQLTKLMPLDYFVMHSSVASVLGNFGQANYSAANAFLDGLAVYRRQLGLAAQSINWGALDTGLLENKETIKKRLDDWGFLLSSEQEIHHHLKMALLLNWTQIVPAKMNCDAYSRRLQASGVKRLLNRVQNLLSSGNNSENSFEDVGNIDQVRFLEPGERLVAYKGYLRELVSRTLAVDKEIITDEVTFSELGIDSVTSMIMINQIHRNTTFRVSAVELLVGDVTIPSMAQILSEFAENEKST